MKNRMFSEVEIDRDVAVCVEHLKGLSPPHQQILSRLLLDLTNERACKEHGFYLAITSLKSIGNKHNKRDHYNNHQSQVLTTTFPVSFTCRTFLPSRGDILQGVVHNVLWAGVFISSGPLRYAFLSLSKMPPDYRYFPANSDGEEKPCFRRDDLTKIAVGVVVRFEVLAVRFKRVLRMSEETIFMFWPLCKTTIHLVLYLLQEPMSRTCDCVCSSGNHTKKFVSKSF